VGPSYTAFNIVLWYKRLERGRFRVPAVAATERSICLDAGELAMLLDGIDFSRVRRPRLWEPPAQVG
jgi:transposase